MTDEWKTQVTTGTFIIRKTVFTDQTQTKVRRRWGGEHFWQLYNVTSYVAIDNDMRILCGGIKSRDETTCVINDASSPQLETILEVSNDESQLLQVSDTTSPTSVPVE